MPSKSSKEAKATNPGATSKAAGKGHAPARGSRADVTRVTQNRTDASRRAGRDTHINWD